MKKNAYNILMRIWKIWNIYIFDMDEKCLLIKTEINSYSIVSVRSSTFSKPVMLRRLRCLSIPTQKYCKDNLQKCNRLNFISFQRSKQYVYPSSYFISAGFWICKFSTTFTKLFCQRHQITEWRLFIKISDWYFVLAVTSNFCLKLNNICICRYSAAWWYQGLVCFVAVGGKFGCHYALHHEIAKVAKTGDQRRKILRIRIRTKTLTIHSSIPWSNWHDQEDFPSHCDFFIVLTLVTDNIASMYLLTLKQLWFQNI